MMRVELTLRDEVPAGSRVEVVEEALEQVRGAVRGRRTASAQRGHVYDEDGAVVGRWSVDWGGSE